VAGIVAAVGPGVPNAHLGREVVLNPGVSCGSCEPCLSGDDHLCRSYALLGENTKGGYAEKLVVPQANLLPKPRGLSMIEAAEGFP
jgi:D-arabinose 1-dehydrogenase-like Zn-dependent alcohol dehydrogenase